MQKLFQITIFKHNPINGSLIVLLLIINFLSMNAQDISFNTSLFYKTRKAPNTQNEKLLVLLHGYGSNENDLFQLSRFFPDNYTIISARATFTLQPGAYQWYKSTRNGQNFDGKKDDLDMSQQKIKDLVIKMQHQYHISSANTIIAGFSQGANMSYQMGLLYPELCKTIGIFSGTIFESQKEQIQKTHNTSLSIFIGHGTLDDRIPFSAAEHSKEWLESAHFKPEFHSYDGMTHSISQQEIQDFISFIQ